MSNNTITLEINITDVDSLLKEDPPLERWSEIVVNQRLRWYGEARVVKPKLNLTDDNNNVDNKTYPACWIFCGPSTPISGIWKCKADFKITLADLNLKDQTPNSSIIREGSSEFETFQGFTMTGWGWDEFIAFDDFLKGDYVKDNQALIRIEVNPGIPSGLHVVEKGRLSTAAIETRKSRTLSLLHSGAGSNVTFITKDMQRLKAHSHILMAASPTFVAMFETTKMNSRPCPDVQLPDLTSACLRQMLKHIYGAPLSKIDRSPLSLIQELIPAAHKYELNELKEYCGHLLVEKWIPGKLWELYQLTKIYKLEGPQKELEEVMKDHVGEILDQAAAEMRAKEDDDYGVGEFS